ncbi:MAG: hypothetical protein SGI88_21935 [Candidatus Hydrogenedentes bacterium]|nr:hypothetical protein [Candidatus Hydrogenedentota bacterium]
MLDRLVEYVLNAGKEELGQLAIQDAALAEVWQRSWIGNPVRLQECEGIAAVVDAWTVAVQPEYQQTEGRRHQWTLREAIDEVLEGRVRRLPWDHVHLLTSVYALTERAQDRAAYSRLRSLIAPYTDDLHALAESLPPAPGMPAISARLHVVTGADIESSRPREIKLFAGVPIHARGPVLIHEKGHLKVLDLVPENCTVVVEDGSVSVEGFVMGRVAASQNCEVRDNISGMVIVRQGNVRSRGVMVRAFVVSKWGSVVCRQAEAPNLLFAGADIVVEGSTTMGVFKAPRVTVHDAVHGGTFHVTKSLNASTFHHTDTRHLAIVLRQNLTCQDYNEDVGIDGLKLINKANRLKRQIETLRERIAQTHVEAEHAARGGIAFLLGGETALVVAERLQRAQHRLALLNRVTNILQSLTGMAEDRLERLSRYAGKSMPEDDESVEEHTSHINEVHAEFKHLQTEGDPEHDINDEMLDLIARKDRILAPNASIPKVSQGLEYLRDRLAAWQKEREQIHQFIAQQESGIQVLQGASERAKGIQTAMPMGQFLRQLITLLRERGDAPNSPQMLRLQGGFLRVILRTVNNRVERAERDRRAIEVLRETFLATSDRLRKEFQIALKEDDTPGEPPTVTGVFDVGVKIYPDAYLLNESVPATGAVLETAASGSARQTYVRGAGRILLVS